MSFACPINGSPTCHCGPTSGTKMPGPMSSHLGSVYRSLWSRHASFTVLAVQSIMAHLPNVGEIAAALDANQVDIGMAFARDFQLHKNERQLIINVLTTHVNLAAQAATAVAQNDPNATTKVETFVQQGREVALVFANLFRMPPLVMQQLTQAFLTHNDQVVQLVSLYSSNPIEWIQVLGAYTTHMEMMSDFLVEQGRLSAKQREFYKVFGV